MSNQSHAHLYGNVSFEARQGAATQEDIDLALGELVLHFPTCMQVTCRQPNLSCRSLRYPESCV